VIGVGIAGGMGSNRAMVRVLVVLLLISRAWAAVPSAAPDPVFGVPHGGEVTGMSYDSANDRIYVAGTFTAWRQPDGAGGWITNPRGGVCALTSAGVLLPWAPIVAGGDYLVVEVHGTALLLFGRFTHVNGVHRPRVAAVSTVDGSLLPFDAQVVGNAVNHGVVVGDTLYLGGDFSEVGGQPRTNLAAVALDTGALRVWNPGCSGGWRGVTTMAASGSAIYLGGMFTTVGGAMRTNAAAVHVDGTLLPWDPSASGAENLGYVIDLAVAHGVVFAGGYFDAIGGVARSRFAALDPTTGAAVAQWPLPCDDYVSGIVPTAGGLYLSGGFATVDGQAHRGLAYATTGGVDAWRPTPNDSYYAMAVGSHGVYGGAGSFHAFPELPSDPVGGHVTTLLHLGTTRDDRITGYPTSAQSILWDEFMLAGWGPEYAIQPSAGVDVGFAVDTTEDPMRWTALTGVTPRPADVRRNFLIDDRMWYFPPGTGGTYVAYYGLWVTVPTSRTVRLRYHSAHTLHAWLDGAPTPIIEAGADVSGLTDDIVLGSGHHRLVLKLFNQGGTDYLALAFEHPTPGRTPSQQRLAPGAPVSDLAFPTTDPLAPSVAAVAPASGSVAVLADEPIQVTFSEPMDIGVAAGACASLTPAVAGDWVWGDRHRLCFVPDDELAASTAYAVVLDATQCRDSAGNALVGTATVAFTTAAAPPPPRIDAVSPATVEAAPFTATITGSGFLRGAVPRLPGWTTRGGSHYVLVSPGDDWDQAQALATVAGGHLATIGDAGEDAFVWQAMGRANGWIGMHDADNDESFAWVDGSPFAYANWSAGEPNSFGEIEDRGIYWWGLRWNDVGSVPESVRPFVIEFDTPAPPRVVVVRGAMRYACAVRWNSPTSLTIQGDASGFELGPHDLVVINTSGDSAGTTLVGGLTVVDTIAPTIAITVPAAALRTSDASATIAGVADDGPRPVAVAWALSGATVRAGTVALSGVSWDFTESLGEGTTIVTVTATDLGGNTASDDVAITVDTVAPTLAFTTPVAGGGTYATSAASLTVAGTSGDAEGVASVWWSMTGATIASGLASGTETWSFAHAFNPGTTTVQVTTADAAGNTNAGSIVVVRDASLPSVVIVAPTATGSFATNGAALTVSGTASATSGVTVVTYALTGATAATGTATGTTTWSFAIPALALGETTATVVARNALGAVSSAVLVITRDVAAPTIVATSVILAGALPDGATALRIEGAAGGDVAATVDLAARTWTATIAAPLVTTVLTLVASGGPSELEDTITVHPLVEMPIGGGG